LLVGQLRDYLAAGWVLDGAPPSWRQMPHVDEEPARCRRSDQDGGEALLDRLTVAHPLQAFSPRYFLPAQAEGHDPRLYTYAHEWRSAHEALAVADEAAVPPLAPDAALTLESLGLFLRHPVKAFFNQRLKVWFELDSAASEDAEPFGFDRLEEFGLGEELLQAALNAEPGQAEAAFEAHKQRQGREGRLPLAGFAGLAQESFAHPAWQAYQIAAGLRARWPVLPQVPAEVALEFKAAGQTLCVEDWLPNLRQDSQGRYGQILARPQAVFAKGGLPKWHNLIRPWVRHLAACAIGLDLTSFVVGPDGYVELRRLETATAKAWLEDLAQAWQEGLARPLPLPCKTAFAWLGGGEEAARAEYEGGYNRVGEGMQDAYLARAFPGFEQVMEDQQTGFEHWLERVYRPLWQTWQGGQTA